MATPLIRALTTQEADVISNTLTELSEHFQEWPEYKGHERALVEFAYYEGCGGPDDSHCGEILAKAAPLALGKDLVENHGCRWVMVCVDDEWNFAIQHPSLKVPINLMTLEDGSWCRENFRDSSVPGYTTIHSFEQIVNHLTHS